MAKTSRPDPTRARSPGRGAPRRLARAGHRARTENSGLADRGGTPGVRRAQLRRSDDRRHHRRGRGRPRHLLHVLRVQARPLRRGGRVPRHRDPGRGPLAAPRRRRSLVAGGAVEPRSTCGRTSATPGSWGCSNRSRWTTPSCATSASPRAATGSSARSSRSSAGRRRASPGRSSTPATPPTPSGPWSIVARSSGSSWATSPTRRSGRSPRSPTCTSTRSAFRREARTSSPDSPLESSGSPAQRR